MVCISAKRLGCQGLTCLCWCRKCALHIAYVFVSEAETIPSLLPESVRIRVAKWGLGGKEVRYLVFLPFSVFEWSWAYFAGHAEPSCCEFAATLPGLPSILGFFLISGLDLQALTFTMVAQAVICWTVAGLDTGAPFLCGKVSPDNSRIPANLVKMHVLYSDGGQTGTYELIASTLLHVCLYHIGCEQQSRNCCVINDVYLFRSYKILRNFAGFDENMARFSLLYLRLEDTKFPDLCLFAVQRLRHVSE